MPEIERHPWQPFVPEAPRVLMLGTFPPKPERWSMEFYYPNKTNDMWRVMGLIFFGDPQALWNTDAGCFRLPQIKALLAEKHIALWDTAMAVRRLRDNASDRFLDIVEPIDLAAMFMRYPTLEAVLTAGEKATAVVASLASVPTPRTGESADCIIDRHRFTLWRLPSTSRAYPLAPAKKAEAYRNVFQQLQIL